MDLRSMLNSDPGAKGTQQNQLNSNPALVKQVFQAPATVKERPPQPPPLQPPGHHHHLPHHHDPRSPTGSSSYGSAQSPYQHTSASTISSGGHYSAHSLVGSSPASHNQQPPSYIPPREGYTSNAASHSHNQHFTPSSAVSPYTPPGPPSVQPPFYQHHQRSQSTHSVPTPTSAHSQPPHPYRDSPISPVPPPHPQPGQYHAIHSQQHSQPGTPLGPPAPYPQLSPNATTHPQAPYNPPRGPSASPYSTPRYPPSEEHRYGPPPAQMTPSQGPPSHPSVSRQYSTGREKSVSVSPKTVPNQIRSSSTLSPLQSRDQHTPIRRDYFGENVPRPEPQRPVSQGAPAPSPSSLNQHSYHPAIKSPLAQQTPLPPSIPQPPTVSPPISQKQFVPIQGQSPSQAIPGPTLKRDLMAQSPPASSIQPPKKKRRRDDSIPIFAQKASNNNPLLPPRRQPSSKLASNRGGSLEPPSGSRQASVASGLREDINGQAASQGVPRIARSFSVDLTNQGPLGPWEPTVRNIIPHEELTKVICDFLFQQVVARNDFESDAATTFEIEAKIGHLIDRDTNERVKIPVETECIVSRDAPGVRIAFESSMTLAQHREFNNFLNKCVLDAKPPPPGAPPTGKPPRVEILYAHKKEKDRFHEVSERGMFSLPPLLRRYVNFQKHKPRVRVTTDTNTGEEIARIIKTRVVDLDIYSPRTQFDWRVSVNVEATLQGNMADLIDANSGRGNRRGDITERLKDRLSYRHLAYQIDLTQVRSTEGPPGRVMGHELEVEISPQLVKEQGQLALAGKPNQYEDLIKGFVDNIRTLVRVGRSEHIRT